MTLPEDVESFRSSCGSHREMRKQVSLFLPLSEWKTLRLEAARQKVSMTELCRRWIKPEMDRLHQE